MWYFITGLMIRCVCLNLNQLADKISITIMVVNAVVIYFTQAIVAYKWVKAIIIASKRFQLMGYEFHKAYMVRLI